MDQKKMQIEEKAWALTREGRFCDCYSRRCWGRKKSRLSTKKLGNIIATRDGSKKKSGSAHLKRPLQEKISFLKFLN